MAAHVMLVFYFFVVAAMIPHMWRLRKVAPSRMRRFGIGRYNKPPTAQQWSGIFSSLLLHHAICGGAVGRWADGGVERVMTRDTGGRRIQSITRNAKILITTINNRQRWAMA